MEHPGGCWDKALFEQPKAAGPDLVCSVCTGVPRELVEAACGHFFGSGCVQGLEHCPVADCSQPDSVAGGSCHPVVYLRRRIDRLGLRCPECSSRMTVGELPDHQGSDECSKLAELGSCPFEELGCQQAQLKALAKEQHLQDGLASHSLLSLETLLQLQLQLCEARGQLAQLAELLEQTRGQLRANQERMEALAAENARKQARIAELESRFETNAGVVEKQRSELNHLVEAFEAEEQRRQRELDNNGAGVGIGGGGSLGSYLGGSARGVAVSTGLLDPRLPLGKTLHWLAHQGDPPVLAGQEHLMAAVVGSSSGVGGGSAAGHSPPPHPYGRQSPGHQLLQAVAPALHKVAREGGDRVLLVVRSDDEIGVDLLQPIPKWFTVDLASFDVCAKAGKSSNLKARIPSKDRHSQAVMRKIETILTELAAHPLPQQAASPGSVRPPRFASCLCLAASALNTLRQPGQLQDALNVFLAAGVELQPVLQPQQLLPGLSQSNLQAACSGLLFLIASWEEY